MLSINRMYEQLGGQKMSEIDNPVKSPVIQEIIMSNRIGAISV